MNVINEINRKVIKAILAFLLAILLIFTVLAQLNATVFITTNNFDASNTGTDTSKQYRLSGSASFGSYGSIVLVKNQPGESGGLFLTQPLATKGTFSFYFQVNMGASKGLVGDGFMIVLAKDSNEIGMSGEGIGYQGISNSLGIEYDTYQNPSEWGVPHFGINKNGEINWSRAILASWGNRENYTMHVWVDYNDGNLEARFSTESTRPQYSTISESLPISLYTGNTFNIGITSSTGDATQQVSVTKFSLSDTYYDGDVANPKFKVNYSLNGKEGEAPQMERVVPNGKATMPSTPVSVGYTFEGWYKEPSCTNEWNFNTNVTDDITLYAKWSISKYTVNFSTSYGTKPSDQIIEHNKKVTYPGNLSTPGYTFEGWFKDNSYSNEWNFDVDKITENTTIYAKWRINQYLVSFDVNGHGSTIEPLEIDYNSVISKPATLTDENYAGYAAYDWYQESACINLWNFSTMRVPASDMTLYAKWEYAKPVIHTTELLTAYAYKNYKASIDATIASGTIKYSLVSGSTLPAGLTLNGQTGEITGKALVTGNFSFKIRVENSINGATFEEKDITLVISRMQYDVTFKYNDIISDKILKAFDNGFVLNFQNPSVPGYLFLGYKTYKIIIDEDENGNIIITTTDELISYEFEEFVIYQNTIVIAEFEQLYRVTFNNNGFGNTPPKTEYMKSGSRFDNPGTLLSDGKKFVGWYTEENIAWNFETDQISNQDLTLFAKWEEMCIVTFENFGKGTKPAATSFLEKGSKVSDPGSLTFTGYVFKGWYKEDSLQTAWDFSTDVVPDADITLYAKWEQMSIVSFENYGKGSRPASTSYLERGSKVSNPGSLSHTGYIFRGWFKEFTFENEWNFTLDTVPASNITLYAKWEQMIIVSFENFGKGIKPSNTDFLEKSTKLKTPGILIQEGFLFLGWFKDSACTNEWNFDNDELPETNITLYAKWEQLYRITYDNNGHGNSVSRTPYLRANHLLTNPGDLQEDGWKFLGWFTDSDQKWNFNTELLPSRDFTLYAKWELLYKVSFNNNGHGMEPNQIKNIEKNTGITKPINPVVNNFIFEKWYRDVQCTVLWDFSNDVVTEDIVLYAKWDIVFTDKDITERLSNKITIKTVIGYEYSLQVIDAKRSSLKSTEEWITGTGGEYSFTELDYFTEYTLQAREKDSQYLSKGISIKAKTDKGNQEIPDISEGNIVVEIKRDKVSIQTEAGKDYSIDGGNTWIKGTGNIHVFDQLEAGKDYNLLVRNSETNVLYASSNAGLTFKTVKNCFIHWILLLWIVLYAIALTLSFLVKKMGIIKHIKEILWCLFSVGLCVLSFFLNCTADIVIWVIALLLLISVLIIYCMDNIEEVREKFLQLFKKESCLLAVNADTSSIAEEIFNPILPTMNVENPNEPKDLNDLLSLTNQYNPANFPINKKLIASYLNKTHGKTVFCKERANHNKTGLLLADTHFAVFGRALSDHNLVCFSYVYQIAENHIILLVKASEKLVEQISQEHKIFLSKFPYGEEWHCVIVDNTFSDIQEIYSLLNQVKKEIEYAYEKEAELFQEEKVIEKKEIKKDEIQTTDDLIKEEVIPEFILIEESDLKEEVFSETATAKSKQLNEILSESTKIQINKASFNKKMISKYLTEAYQNSILCNERLNNTKTGLLLADTHYIKLSESKKVCFIYVYEIEDNKILLLLKINSEFAEKIKEKHSNIYLSQYPKGGKWYSLLLDDSFEEFKDLVCILEEAIKNIITEEAGKLKKEVRA